MASSSTYGSLQPALENENAFQSYNIDPNASEMSLYKFRRSSRRFHWKGISSVHKVLPDSEPWPLQHVAKLSNQEKAQALVWASKVTADDHGFSDTVADKIVKYNTEEEKTKARIEVENLRKLNHNHIVAFLGSYTKGDHLGILMFPVAAMDLGQFLESSDVHQWVEQMRPWFSCLTRALTYLHTRKNPFKHRDIKPANILIDRTGTAFLTDFGISKEYSSHQDSVTTGDGRFTIEYASPSMVNQTNQGLESDIFCLGCVFLEMATVMLGKQIRDMHEYISECTGIPNKIEYHRDFARLADWVKELKELVKDDSPSHLIYLANQGLDMILQMITECATEWAPNHTFRLENVSRVMDGMRSQPCRSCIDKADPEPIFEGEQLSLPRETNSVQVPETTPQDHDSSQLQPGLSRESHSTQESRPQNLSDVENAEILLDGHSHRNKVEEIHSPTSATPGIYLCRRSTNCSELRDSSDLQAVMPGPPLQNTQEQGSSPDLSPTQSPATAFVPPHAGNRGDGGSRDRTEPMSGQIQSDVVSNKEHPSPTNDETSSNPITKIRTNSRIRMVDTRKKSLNIMFYENVDQVPGDFILTYNRERGKWCAKPKAQFTQLDLRRGILCRLPRGLWSNYRVPSGPGTIGGFFRPWRQLSLSKNLKRMFGRSMPIMFIEGRKTTEELRADLNS